MQNVDAVVAKYLELRDHVDALKKKHKTELEPFTAAMEKIESSIREHLNKIGAESIKTPNGTAYKTKFTSATVADKELVKNFVKTQDMWDMLDIKVNKTFVETYLSENETLPPGVNWRVEQAVNIRRS